MSKKKDRFIKVYSQDTIINSSEIWIDTETGVNYLYHISGYSGGVTPLLGADGKVVVTPLSEL